MKAPDKIFVHRTIHLGFLSGSEINITGHDEEYIRKAALLEWAKNLKERWEEPPMSRHSPGCVYMLEQLINKLSSM